MGEKSRRSRRRAAWLVLPAALSAGAAPAEEPPAAGERPGFVDRFRYDNDLFLSRDDAFFAGGFGFERYSPPLAGWDRRPGGRPRRPIARWVGKTVPGLDPAGDRVLRFGFGLAHTSQTPDDLRTSELQLDDVPYAGTLGAFWSWTAYDDGSLAAFQVYAGVLGPLAGSREVHELVHRGLGRGPRANGFRWQLDNEPLLNLNYALKRKIAGPSEVEVPGWQGDLAVGFHQALGNYHTATDLQLEFRAGPRLPGGFAQISDPVGPGVGIEPILPSAAPRAGGRPRFHASLAVRATALWYTALLDGNTFTDAPHRGVGYDTFFFSAIAGVHVDFGRFAAHLSYFGSGIAAELQPATRTTPSWLSLTFDVRRLGRPAG